MSTLEELRDQIEKAERQMKIIELQIAHYRNIMQQETDIASRIGDRILDIRNSLEASNNEQHRIQERILSCVENRDDSAVLATRKELVDLTFNFQKLVDQQTTMDEMKEVAEQEARSLERQLAKAETIHWHLRMDLGPLRKQYTQMGGTFDQS
ncbi:hypothetical protein FS837_002987 [Tulasnella sp. UAMH 9824]|nr:hypothetical protein FS837_002987 [Tulasnella sp. UAMH 9824]